MGRVKSTAVADKYFEEEKIASADAKSGITIRYTCKCCHSEPFLGLTGTKKIAHLVGVPGCGIQKCAQSKIKIGMDEFRGLAKSTKCAREWLERGAGSDHPLLSGVVGKRTPVESECSLVE